MKSEDLDPYDGKTCVRFNTDRQLKKSDYKEAVDQIESARNGNDPAPLITDDKSMKGDFDVTADITDNDNSADESQLHIAESPAPLPVPKATPNPQKRKAAPVKPKPEASPLEAETKENDEKVSRSGRKIKEKKMNTDEMDPDEMFTQPRKRIKVDDGKQKAMSLLAESNSAIDDFRASKLHILTDPVKKGILDCQYDMIHTVQDIKLALGLEQADIDRSIELLESFKTKTLPTITNLMLLKYPNTVDTVKRLRKYIGNLNSWEMEDSQVKQFHEKAETIRSTASSIYSKFSVSLTTKSISRFSLTLQFSFQTMFNFKDESSFWAQFAEEQKKFQEKYVSLTQADLFEGLSYEGNFQKQIFSPFKFLIFFS